MGAVCDCVRNEEYENKSEIISVRQKDSKDLHINTRTPYGGLYDDKFGATYLSDENFLKTDNEQVRGSTTNKARHINNYDTKAIEEDKEEDDKIIRAPVVTDLSEIKEIHHVSEKNNIIVDENPNQMEEFHQINVVSSSHEPIIQSNKKKHDTYQFKNPNMKKSPINKDNQNFNLNVQKNEQVNKNKDNQENNNKTNKIYEKEIEYTNGQEEDASENEGMDEGIL